MDLPPLILDSSTPSPADFRQDRDPMSLPRKSRNGTRGYAHLVEIDVPVARVWRALTEPGLIKIWSGQEAEIDPRRGEGKTSLRLLGSGIPDAPEWDRSYASIRMGWERFMGRIKVTLESPPVPKKPAKIVPKDPPLRGLDY